MSLREWRANRWLVDHQTSRAEIAELLALAARGLADAAVEGLSADARVGLGYGSAIALATAALAAAGYRAGRERHHERVLDSLLHTIDAAPLLVTQLHRIRRLRNAMTYERVGLSSQKEAQDLIDLVRRLERLTTRSLRTQHPELMPGA